MLKFTMKFESGADAEFVIPKEHLAKYPETMLSVLSKSCWNTDDAAAHVITPVPPVDFRAVPVDFRTVPVGLNDMDDMYDMAGPITPPVGYRLSWADGTAEAIVAWYGRDGAAFELPFGVELRDFATIADWLQLDLDLDAITYPDGNDDGNLALVLRAKAFAKGRGDLEKALAAMKEAMCDQPSNKYEFVFLRLGDSLEYINILLADPLRTIGIGAWRQDHYEWAQDELFREECAAQLEDFGLNATWSNKKHLQIDVYDGRGVYAERWVLQVTVPKAEPAAKRRRLA